MENKKIYRNMKEDTITNPYEYAIQQNNGSNGIDAIGILVLFIGLIISILAIAFQPDKVVLETINKDYKLIGVEQRDMDGLGTIRSVIIYEDVVTKQKHWTIKTNQCFLEEVGTIKSITAISNFRENLIGKDQKWTNNNKQEVLEAFCS